MSLEYYDDEYFAFRTLLTPSELTSKYAGIRARINDIRADQHYNIAYCEPYLLSSIDALQFSELQDISMGIQYINIVPGSEWPFVVQYHEQLAHLPNNAIYIVSYNTDYYGWQHTKEKGAPPFVHITTIKRPFVRDHYGKEYVSHEELLTLNTDKAQQMYRIYGETDSEAAAPYLSDCSIGPISSRLSATFCIKHVAQAFANSLERHIAHVTP